MSYFLRVVGWGLLLVAAAIELTYAMEDMAGELRPDLWAAEWRRKMLTEPK